MGKPEHHCDPKDPPYLTYEQFVTTTTTLPPVTSYITYPNHSSDCPDLSYKSDSLEGLGCVKLSGSPYEVLAINDFVVCKQVSFRVVDNQCSKGAILQYRCCSNYGYFPTNILVSGENTLFLKYGSELRLIYGEIEDIIVI